MICVIPSAGRAGNVITHRMFEKPYLCVPESEAEAYRKYHPDVVAHPDTVYGMGEKRQWILDNFDEDIIFMADDDNEYLCFMGAPLTEDDRGYHKITDPSHVWEVLLNTANIARSLGTNLFGFNEICDRRKFDYISPFSTRERINGFAMGIIRDGQRFDTRLVVKQDFDFFLMSLYWKRFIWRDNRYCFQARHYTNAGGLCAHRSRAKELECVEILKQKYGAHLFSVPKDRPWNIKIKKC